MSYEFPDITGVILAGGRSARFGTNKAFARYQGVPLIFRVLKVVKYLFADTLLITNTPEEYKNIPVKTIADEEPYLGPLGGIVTALKTVGSEMIFVTACDLPLLNIQEIRSLGTQVSKCDAVIPFTKEGPAYTMAFYSQQLLPDLNSALRAGRLSLKDFFQNRSRVLWLPFQGMSAYNVNTQDDLRVLIQELPC